MCIIHLTSDSESIKLSYAMLQASCRMIWRLVICDHVYKVSEQILFIIGKPKP